MRSSHKNDLEKTNPFWMWDKGEATLLKEFRISSSSSYVKLQSPILKQITVAMRPLQTERQEQL